MSQEKKEASTWIRIMKLIQMGVSLHGMRKELFYLHQRQFGWNHWENVINFWQDHHIYCCYFYCKWCRQCRPAYKLSSIDLIREISFNCVRSDSVAETLIFSCLFCVWYFVIVTERLMYFGSQYLYNWFVLINIVCTESLFFWRLNEKTQYNYILYVSNL